MGFIPYFICPKDNLIARLEFKLNNIAVYYVSQYATKNHLRLIMTRL